MIENILNNLYIW